MSNINKGSWRADGVDLLVEHCLPSKLRPCVQTPVLLKEKEGRKEGRKQEARCSDSHL
jgi:hypothetical protein